MSARAPLGQSKQHNACFPCLCLIIISLIRVGLVTYSSGAGVRFNLSTAYDATTIEANIMSAKFLNGGTATGHGLNAAVSLLTAPSLGARGGAAVIVLVTDEPAQETATYLATAASNARAVATVYAIGVGPNEPLSELSTIAGATGAVYQLAFTDLGNTTLIDSIADSIDCISYSTTTKTTSTTTTFTTTTTSLDFFHGLYIAFIVAVALLLLLFSLHFL